MPLNSNTLATWCKEPTHWKKPWCWERLRVGGEGDDRGWDGWMASLTQWTWVWVNSGSWWLTGRPGVLRFMGLQRVGHDWTTELNWTADISVQSPRSPVGPSLCLTFSVSGDSGSPYHCRYSGMTTLSNPLGDKIPSSSAFAWPLGLPDQTHRASVQVCEVCGRCFPRMCQISG